MKKITNAWMVVAAIFIAAWIYSAATYPCEYQIDARDRQYHKATVVDKIGDTSCGKYGRCEDYLYVTLQLDDGQYNRVRINRDGYDSAIIGNEISMSRNYTDPICVSHEKQSKNILLYFIWFLGLTAALSLLVLILFLSRSED